MHSNEVVVQTAVEEEVPQFFNCLTLVSQICIYIYFLNLGLPLACTAQHLLISLRRPHLVFDGYLHDLFIELFDKVILKNFRN